MDITGQAVVKQLFETKLQVLSKITNVFQH